MPQHINTRTTYGDTGALNKLVGHELEEFNDDTLNIIGSSAFYGQDTLESIYLPNISELTTYAFYGNTALRKIYIGLNKQTVVPCQATAFSECSKYIIIVPDNLVNDYKTATNWVNIAYNIFGVSDEANWPSWDETEIADDIATIKSHVLSGTAISRYNYGQYKSIDLGAEGVIRMQIVGKNMRELANSTDKAQLEWMAMDVLATQRGYNPAYEAGVEGTGTLGGFDKSELKTYLDTTIWALIPSDWQDMIKETKIVTRSFDTSNTATRNEITTAKLRIPSAFEMGGSITNEMENSGPRYSYVFSTNADRYIRDPIYTYTSGACWLRTACTYTRPWFLNAGTISMGDDSNYMKYTRLSFST